MIKKLRALFFNDKSYEPREYFVRVVILFGVIISVLSLLQLAFAHTGYLISVFFVILLVTFLFCGFLTFRYRKYEMSATIIGIVCTIVIYPSFFFLAGGLEGGAVIYMVLGIFYSIAMFRGTKMYIMTALSLISDAATYFYGYYHPEKIVKMSAPFAYGDSIFAIIVVGLIIGYVVKFQIREYDKRRVKAVAQKEEAVEKAGVKTDFFANMSHELRSPLNTIIGLNEINLRDDSLSPEVRMNSKTIGHASNMLLSLVNDILDIAKIESDKMRIVRANYETKDMFHTLIELTYPRAREKGLEFIIDIDSRIPSVMNGDEKRIKQILLNILTNAIKYTKEGQVILHASYEKINSGLIKLVVSVEDTGIGIKREYMDSLFESFTQVDSAENHHIEGTGLGLSISRQLAVLMGGNLSVDSIYTKGSTFTLELEQTVINPDPIGEIGLLASSDKTDVEYDRLFEAPEANILVVDDNPMNLMLASRILRDTKMQVDVCDTPEKALELTAQKFYHIILMDYFMPVMNGDEVTSLIQKQENGMCINSVFFVLTADPALSDTTISKEKGFDDYVEKPFRGAQLEEKILAFLPSDIIAYRKEKTEDFMVARRTVYKTRKKKIIISTDCVADMSDEDLKEFGIKCMYIYINTPKSRFWDTKELSSDNMLRFFGSENMDVWSEAAPVEDYVNYFANILSEAENVIHIAPGGEIGTSYVHANAAAKSFGHVRVIDSGKLSGGIALLVIKAQQMADRGMDVDEIVEAINYMKSTVVNAFLIPSASVLNKRGYINVFVADTLDAIGVHPSFKTTGSRIRLSSVYTGNIQSARKKFVRRILFWRKNPNPEHVILTHAGLTVKEIDELVDEIKRASDFNNIHVQKCSVTNALFSGLGAVSLSFFNE